MSISHLLEDFGAHRPSGVVEMSEVLLEEERLEAFEKGYQAGWDDSAKAKDQSSGQISSEIAEAIQALTLTHEEASASVLTGLKPLITQIVQTVLPRVAQDTLAQRLTEVVSDLVAEHGAGPLVINVAPGQGEALESLETPVDPSALSIVEDPSLAPQDVRLQLGGTLEQELNLSATIDQIAEVIDAYFNIDETTEQRISA